MVAKATEGTPTMMNKEIIEFKEANASLGNSRSIITWYNKLKKDPRLEAQNIMILFLVKVSRRRIVFVNEQERELLLSDDF